MEYRRCHVFRIAFSHGFERKGSGDIDQHVQPAEMRGHGIDRLRGLIGIGEIDATEMKLLGGRRNRRGCMIDCGHFRAPRNCGVHNDLAEGARGTGDDDDFSVHCMSPLRHGTLE